MIIDCGFCLIEKTLHIFSKKEEIAVTQRTLGGTNRKQKRKSGFRARMRTKNGRRVIQARRSKGRHKLAV